MLALNRLDRQNRTALIEQIAGTTALTDDVVAQIADRTDGGVPLFVEELTKSVLESDVPRVGIPTTLHDSLMARLDRMSSVRLGRQSDASSPTPFCAPSPVFPRMSCASRLADSSLPSWCSSAALRPMRPMPSSTPWCRAWHTVAYCGLRGSNCMLRWPRLWKPNRPS